MSHLICIEGPDGAGKSTQIRMLMEKYPDAIFTREPGGTSYAEQIRSLIFEGADASAETLFMLFWAARAEHLDKLIAPALHQGKMVITDRFDLSTFAYQLRGQLNTEELDEMFWYLRNNIVLDKLVGHSLCYVYLDVAIETSIARLADRNGEETHFDTRGIEFHTRVRNGGHEFIESERGGQSYIIDAGFNAETVFCGVAEAIEQILKEQ